MKIPETTGLFGKAITGKPGELKIAAVIKAANAPGDGIGNFFLTNEFFDISAIKEKIAISIRSVDTVIS